MNGYAMDMRTTAIALSAHLLALSCFYNPSGSVSLSAGSTTGTSGADPTTGHPPEMSSGDLITGGAGTSTGVGASATSTTGASMATTSNEPGSSTGAETTTGGEAPLCGNGAIDDGETCDDGNIIDTDACIACKKSLCGDGYTENNVEACDDGEESPNCNSDCSVSMCGDSKVNASAGEVCDFGVKNGIYNSGCTADCSGPGKICGDGIISDPEEMCDILVPLANATCKNECQSMACAEDFSDCDDKVATGCEINTSTDKNHCGDCNQKCGVIEFCENGKCTF